MKCKRLFSLFLSAAILAGSLAPAGNDTPVLVPVVYAAEEVQTALVTVTCENGTVMDASGTEEILSGTNVNIGEEFSFTVVPTDDYKVTSVTCNEEALTDGEGGVYTVTVAGDIAIHAVCVQMAAPVFTVAAAPAGIAREKAFQITVLSSDAPISTRAYSVGTQYTTVAELGSAILTGNAHQITDGTIITENDTYYVYITDEDGRMATQALEISDIDREGPAAATVTRQTEGWQKEAAYEVSVPDITDVTRITLTVPDGTEADLTPDENGEYRFTAAGTGKYVVTLYDEAGNTAVTSVLESQVDNTAPTVTATRSGDGWATSASYTYTASDEGSGVQLLYVTIGGNTTTIFFDAEDTYILSLRANQTAYIKAVDFVGNEFTYELNESYIDTQPPEISVPVRSVTGWAQEAAYTFTVTDAGSGIQEVSVTIDGGTPVVLTPDENGQYRFTMTQNTAFRIQVTDNLGQTAAYDGEEAQIDTAAPELGSMDRVTNGWAQEAVYKFTASDNTALDSVSVLCGGESIAVTEQEGVYSFTAAANRSYVVAVTDAAGNKTEYQVEETQVDTTAPTVTAARNETGWVTSAVYTYAPADEGSGVQFLYVTVGGNTETITFDPAKVYTLTLTGNETATIRAVDFAGNEFTLTVTESQIDTTAPAISNLTRSTDAWATSVTYTFQATDHQSGVAAVTVALGGAAPVTLTPDAAGNYSFTAAENLFFEITAEDNLGHKAAVQGTEEKIDQADPRIRDVARHTSGWSQYATYTFVAEDGLSGIASVSVLCDAAPVAVTENGGRYQFTIAVNGSLTITVTDAAGNDTSYSVTESLVDTTAPGLSQPVRQESGWVPKSNYTFTAADAESGIASIVLLTDNGQTALTPAADGTCRFSLGCNQTVTVEVTDLAGNITKATVTESHTDPNTPVISGLTRVTDGWNTSAKYTFQVSDDLAGISSVSVLFGSGASQTLTPDSTGICEFTMDTNDTFQIQLTDNAGNISTLDGNEAMVDTIAPMIQSVSRLHDSWAYSITYSIQASDNLAGISSVKVSFDGQTVDAILDEAGNYSFVADANTAYTVTVTDYAGNASFQTVTEALIDQTAPVISDVARSNPIWSQFAFHTFKAEDTASGVYTVKISDGTRDIDYVTAEDGSYRFFVNINGTYTVTVTDTVGNTATIQIQESLIDLQPPVISQILPQSEWDAEKNTVILHASDESEFASLAVTDTAGRDYAVQEQEPGVFQIVADHNGTYTAVATDTAGNSTSVQFVVWHIDTEVPEAPALASTGGEKWVNTDVTVTATAADSQSSVAAYWYTDQDIPFDPATWTQAAFTDGIGTVSFTQEQDTVYYFVAQDLVGRISEKTAIRVAIDKTAPTELELTYLETEGSGYLRTVDGKKIYNDKITFFLRAQDTASGVVSYEFQAVTPAKTYPWVQQDGTETGVTQSILLGDTNAVIWFRATDEAGNCSEGYTNMTSGTPETVILENTPAEESEKAEAPVLEAMAGGEAYEGTWTNQDVTIRVSGSQAISGIEYYEWMLQPAGGEPTAWEKVPMTEDGQFALTISTDMNGTYLFRAITYAGNPSQVVEQKVRIQKTAPKPIVFVPEYPTGTNGWYTSIPGYGLQYPAQDPLCANVEYEFFYSVDGWEFISTGENPPVITGDGIWRIYAVSTDKAGNTATSEIITFKVEQETAAAPGLAAKAGDDSYNGIWTNRDVTIQVSDSSATSGIAYYEWKLIPDGPASAADWQKVPQDENGYFVLTLTDDENCTAVFRAVTYAGNHSLEASMNVHIQKTVPAPAAITPEAPTGTNGWYTSLPDYTYILPEAGKWSAPVRYEFYYSHNDGDFICTGSKAPEITGDGIWKLYIAAIDESGNRTDSLVFTFKVDTQVPDKLSVILNGTQQILQASDAASVHNGINVADRTVKTNFSIFLNEAASISVSADGSDSGLAALYYQLHTDNSQFSIEGNWKEVSGTIYLQPDSRNCLFFKAVDNAGNITYFSGTSVLLDSKAPGGNDPMAAITMVPTEENLSTHGFYYGDVTVNVHIEEPVVNNAFSGLAAISYRVLADGLVTQSGTLTLDNTHISTQEGRVLAWDGAITILSEKNDSNNVILEITALDTAGNARLSRTETIRIDVTDPQIRAVYDNNKPAQERNNTAYFTGSRSLTVTVNEQNFVAAESFVWVTDNDTGKSVAYTWNSTGYTHTAVLDIREDGHYTVSASITDSAGNNTTGIIYETGIVAGSSFVLDNTRPRVTVSYDNNDAQGIYFDAPRTAVITVTERNFDPADLVSHIRVTPDTGLPYEIPVTGWTSNGNVHTAYVRMDKDGTYSLSVSCTDIPGNASEGTGYLGTATQNWVIDQTISEPQFSGVEDGSAYSGKAIPVITYQDTNLNTVSVKIYRTRMSEIRKDVTEELLAGQPDAEWVNGDKVWTLDLFPVEEAYDGIYTLEATIVDKAGNTTMSSITLSINRFGSTYQYSDDLMAVNGKVVYKLDKELVITEINPTQLQEGSAVIQITRDGTPVANPIYTIEPTADGTEKPADHGWYEYRYVISSENFKEDGIYTVVLSTKDAAGNVPENTSESQTIRFAIDTTAPELTSVVGLEEAIIKADSLTIRFEAMDNISLDSIQVYLNGELDVQWTNLDTYFLSETYTIPEGLEQHIRFVITDKAGNVLDTDADTFSPGYVWQDVTISSNALLRFYANKPLFFGTTGTGGVGIIALLLLWLKKRKKKAE